MYNGDEVFVIGMACDVYVIYVSLFVCIMCMNEGMHCYNVQTEDSSQESVLSFHRGFCKLKAGNHQACSASTVNTLSHLASPSPNI